MIIYLLLATNNNAVTYLLMTFPNNQVSSQHPYTEQYIGRPHVVTVDYNNTEETEAAILEIINTKVK